MRLEEIKRVLDARVLCDSGVEDVRVSKVCASDLLSDVLAFAQPGDLLLTGLVNAQVVRTAEMVEIATVIFVRAKEPGKDTVMLAADRGLPLLCTKSPMFEACALLHNAGLRGRSES